MASSTVALTDTLTAAGTMSPRVASPAGAVEELTFAGAGLPRGRHKAAPAERLKVSGSAAVAQRLTVQLTSTVSMRGVPRSGLYGRLAERLAIGGTLTSKQRVVLREMVRLLGRGSPVATRYALARAGIALSDSIDHARGLALEDTLNLQPRAAAVYGAVTSMVDRLELTASLGYQLMATVLVQDDVQLDDTTILHALFHGHLQDMLDFVLDVVDPLGDVTTWVMNPRTNAITEYLNYGFNGFARSATGGYLAAGDDGLYELSGVDDAGTPVIADVISGLADFSGVFLSGLQAAYLGIRGDGEFFLKLTSAEGRSTTYAVKAQSMRTARVNLGKGWRARYMTWELISTGQDFSLLDVTFLPIQSTRRV